MMTTVGGIDSLLRRAGDNTDAIDGAMDAARMFVEEPAPAPPGRARDCGLPFMCSSRPPPPPDPAKVILLLTLRMCASMLSRPPLRIRASEQTGRTWDGSREAIQLGNVILPPRPRTSLRARTAIFVRFLGTSAFAFALTVAEVLVLELPLPTTAAGEPLRLLLPFKLMSSKVQ
jgi:hypothetical protein